MSGPHNISHLSTLPLYPLAPTTTTSCSDCSLNSNIIANKCTILIPTSQAIKFFGRPNPDKTLNFHANYLDLLHSIILSNPSPPLLLPNLNISTIQTLLIFQSSLALDLL